MTNKKSSSIKKKLATDADVDYVNMYGESVKFPKDDPLLKPLSQGWYAAPEQIFLARYLKPGDCFVDYGAHAGLFSVVAHHVVGKNGHVIAAESNIEILPYLESNLGVSPIAVGGVVPKLSNTNIVFGPRSDDQTSNNAEQSHNSNKRSKASTHGAISLGYLSKLLEGMPVTLLRLDISGQPALPRGLKDFVSSNPNLVIMFNDHKFTGRDENGLPELISNLELKPAKYDYKKNKIVKTKFGTNKWYESYVLSGSSKAVNKRLAEKSPSKASQQIEDYVKKSQASIELYELSRKEETASGLTATSDSSSVYIDEIERLNAQLMELSQSSMKLETLEQQVKFSTYEHQQMREQLMSAQALAAKTRQELFEKNGQILQADVLKDEIAALKFELNAANKRWGMRNDILTQRDEAYEELLSEFEVLLGQLSKAENDLRQSKKRSAAAEASVSSLKSSNESLARDLTETRTEYDQKMTELQRKLESKTESLKKSQAQNQSYVDEISVLQSDLEKLAQSSELHNQGRENEAHKLTDQLATMQGLSQKQQSKISGDRAEMAALAKEIETLHALRENTISDLQANHSEEIAKLEAEMKAQAIQTKQLKSRLIADNEQMKAKDAEILDLQRQCSLMEQKIQSVSAARDALIVDLQDEHKDEIALAENKLFRLQAKYEEGQKEIASRASEIEELQKSLTRKDALSLEQTEMISNLTDQRDALQSEIEMKVKDFEESLAETDTKLQAALQSLDEKSSRLSDAEKERAYLLEEKQRLITQAENDLVRLQAKYEGSQKEIASRTSEIAELQKSLTRKDVELQSTLESLEEKSSSLSDSENERADLLQEKQRLAERQENAQLFISKSSGDLAAVLEDIEGSRLVMQRLIAETQAAKSSKWVKLGRMIGVGPKDTFENISENEQEIKTHLHSISGHLRHITETHLEKVERGYEEQAVEDSFSAGRSEANVRSALQDIAIMGEHAKALQRSKFYKISKLLGLKSSVEIEALLDAYKGEGPTGH